MDNRFVIDQKHLFNILASMQPICTKRTALEATSSVLFYVGHKELVLKATDLEISLQSSYPLEESSIDEPCSFLVSGRRIFELVKELDGIIEFYFNTKQLVLRSGPVNLSLNIKDAQEFPPFPERIENLMQFNAVHLLGLLNKVSFLIPQNNVNPAFNGLFFEISNTGLTMTTTDGHCLAQVSTDRYTLEESRTWLIPRRAVFEVKKLLENIEEPTIFLGTCGSQLVFSGLTFNFFSRVLVDQFPRYESILQHDGFILASIDRCTLVKALRRSACLLSGQFIATQFSFAPERLSILMHNKEVGMLEEDVPLTQFAGGSLVTRFYAPYLLNGLQVLSEEKVTLFLKNSSLPIIFESSHENDSSRFLYLVMPITAVDNP